MNTREKFEQMLVTDGMFPEQAAKVMAVAIPEVDKVAAENGYKFTWERPADEYPAPIYAVVYAMNIKPVALKWIDENIPRAWFRPMFE